MSEEDSKNDQQIANPSLSVSNWPSLHLIPSHEAMPTEAASHDGADSGIDVVNVHETPLQTMQTPAAGKDSRDGKSAMSMRETPYLHYPEANYTRWGLSGLGRRATDPRGTDRMIRLATASSRQRARNERLGSMLSDGTLRMPGKLVTWHVAMESRPPLRIDMSGPTPTTYSPRNKPLYETNSPSYSFGRKDAEIKGSGQRAWAKLWFRSHSPFTHKTNYELNWPTASHYVHKSTIGPRQPYRTEYPSHSIGVRQNLKIVDSLKPDIPASNQYVPELASRQVLPTAPAFSMGPKLPTSYWKKSFEVPAPNAYNPRHATRAVKPSHPAFTMCVQRRYKRHDLGPFATT